MSIIMKITKIVSADKYRYAFHRNEIIILYDSYNCQRIRYTFVFRKHMIRVVILWTNCYTLKVIHVQNEQKLSSMYENFKTKFLKTMEKYYIIDSVKTRRRRDQRSPVFDMKFSIFTRHKWWRFWIGKMLSTVINFLVKYLLVKNKYIFKYTHTYNIKLKPGFL